MTKKRIIFSVILALLIVLTVSFIWSRSVSNGSQSSQESEGVYETVVGIVEEVGGTAAADRFQEKVTPKLFRKFAHFSEFALLGLEVNLFFICLLKFNLLNILWSCLFGLFTAGVDEMIQYFTAGRDAKITDVLIDFSGFAFLTAMVSVIGFIAVRSLKKKKTKPLQENK